MNTDIQTVIENLKQLDDEKTKLEEAVKQLNSLVKENKQNNIKIKNAFKDIIDAVDKAKGILKIENEIKSEDK